MLRFLNGNQNVVGTTNENDSRELQELFTIGRNGGYTETDVREAARALTGWVDTGYCDITTAGLTSSFFKAAKHDTTDKTFSATYQNRVIKGRIQLNVSTLPTGNYILHVETQQGLLSKRVLVVHE